MPSFLVNHKSSGHSRRATGNVPKSTTSGGDTSMQGKHASNGHDSSLVEQASGTQQFKTLVME